MSAQCPLSSANRSSLRTVGRSQFDPKPSFGMRKGINRDGWVLRACVRRRRPVRRDRSEPEPIGDDVETVIVDGRIVMENGRVAGVDFARLRLREASGTIRRLV